MDVGIRMIILEGDLKQTLMAEVFFFFFSERDMRFSLLRFKKEEM